MSSNSVSKDLRFRKRSKKKTPAEADERFAKVLTDVKFGGKPKRKVNPADIPSKDITSSDASDDGEFKWNQVSDDSDASETVATPAYESESEESSLCVSDETSNRLSIMSCDWDAVTADDLFVMLHTFLNQQTKLSKPRILNVSVYPSEFGFKELEYESVHGPRLLGVEDLKDVDEALLTESQLKENERRINEAVRAYQKLRLKYYYAIAVFDSIETASFVYSELDGIGASFCSSKLDMRFVPDSITDFPHSPVSSCDRLPERYEPPLIDGGAAKLNDNSKVKLTWDEDPVHRKILKRKFNKEQLAQMDLDEYLASSSSGSEVEDKEAYRRKLLADLLSEGEDDQHQDGKETRGDEKAENVEGPSSEDEEEESGASSDGSMEMAVNQNYDSLAKKIASGKQPKSALSPWEQYQLKRKEKNKQKKKDRKMNLLMTSQPEVVESKKLSAEELTEFIATKSKKVNEVESVTKDSRFTKIFEDDRFAIDPTNKNFDKKSNVMKEVIQEKIKRRKTKH
jgi:NUC153 domain